MPESFLLLEQWEEQKSLWSTENTSEAVGRRETGVTSPLGARSGTCKAAKTRLAWGVCFESLTMLMMSSQVS